MQPQDQQALFAFSLPPHHQSNHNPSFNLNLNNLNNLNNPTTTTTTTTTSLAPILTSNLALLDPLPPSPSLDSSLSPSSALLRPSTASGLFAYSVPPIPLHLSPSQHNHKHSPPSSAPPPTNSPVKTSPPLPPPLPRLSLSSTDSSSASPASFHLLAPPPAPPPAFHYGSIGPHNTRPMTAPGAGWDAGSFNHDYDYTSASLGLYATSAYHIDSPVLSPPTTVPTHSSPDDAGSSTTATSPDQMLSLFPCFAPPIMLPATTATSSSSRPSTHAGTQLSFGAASAIRDHDGSLRPSTAASTTDHPGLPMPQRPDSSPYQLWKHSSPASEGLVDPYQHQLHQGFQVLQSLRGPTTAPSGSDDAPAPPLHPHHLHYQQQRPFQFNLLPGAPRKRARRRFDEVERLYQCNYPGCTKSYGTLNHLNAHIIAQKHGPKRLPQEFKEIRKEWRARKKAEAESRTANLLINHHHQPQQSSSVGSTAAYLGSAWNGLRGKQ